MKKWEGGVPGARAEISLQPVVQTVAVSLLLMEVHAGAKIHLQPLEDPTLEKGKSVRSPFLRRKEINLVIN